MATEYIFDGAPGSTSLEEEEKEQLIPRTITTRSQLNEEEQLNILAGTLWLDGSRMKAKDLLTTKRIQSIHRRMFDRVWKWAGKFRQSNKNIGIPWSQIPVSLDSLFNDTLIQIGDIGSLRWSNDEIAIRFHHRLVAIHPFVNGNGRHARLVTDKLLTILGEEEFTWGQSSLDHDGDARQRYIEALGAADKHNYSLLLAFARS
jgi:Fic-DOC domain mobile mystery protein B